MGLTIIETCKQIINPIMGLYLNEKVIPQNSKGNVTDLDFQNQLVCIQWKIDENNVSTTIPFIQYEKMKSVGIIDYADTHVTPPEPKFKVGDLVKGICNMGIVLKYTYNAVEEEYEYKIIRVDGVLDDDYDLKYDFDDESDLKLVQNIDEQIEFNDRTYRIRLEEIVKHVEK